MNKVEYDIFSDKETLSQDKQKIFDKYANKEKIRQDKILKQILEGAGEEFLKQFVMFPIGKLASPVRIPCWMFRKFPDDPDFELDDIEKVALAHVIHFTTSTNPWGYLECSGDIENWCKCSKEEAQSALKRLIDKNMIFCHVAPEDKCLGHCRNKSYTINIDYLHTILTTYGTDIWV